MRSLAFAIVIAAASQAFAPISTFAMSGRCEELRLACEHKDQLGERGGGDCRAYRMTCLRQMCRELRWQCIHKEATGGQGQGYCQNYRDNCVR